jgi:hypothetical protein
VIVHRGHTFYQTYHNLVAQLRDAPQVWTERWQGVAANQDTRELLNAEIEVDLHGSEDLDYWRSDCAPSLPWADDHFLERVGGEPLNPGVEWANWPWGHSANKFRGAQGRFNHNYMERLWPKFARRTEDGKLPLRMKSIRRYPHTDSRPKIGIGYEYGDLEDLVDLLAHEPYTRQAWIPLFYPEETGRGDGGRKMCSLGYQFIVRDGHLHMYYPLRSCDLIRHWRDDCYLAVRMLLWVLDRCRDRNIGFWEDVVPGTYAMHCTSLHVFSTDVI